MGPALAGPPKAARGWRQEMFGRGDCLGGIKIEISPPVRSPAVQITDVHGAVIEILRQVGLRNPKWCVAEYLVGLVREEVSWAGRCAMPGPTPQYQPTIPAELTPQLEQLTRKTTAP